MDHLYSPVCNQLLFLDINLTVHSIFPEECLPRVTVMPNPWRKIAGGEELVVLFLPIWVDDVSANRTKQYNKHINVYLQISNLPGRLLQQTYFVRFVSSSGHATSPEQLSAIIGYIVYVFHLISMTQALTHERGSETHTNPVRCFNGHTRRPCRTVLRVPCDPADNPQQSEEASHMCNGNCLCRKCKVGGPAAVTESNEGFHALHVVSLMCLFTQSIKLNKMKVW